MRARLWLAVVLPAAIVSGCIPSRPLAEGRLDELWALSEDPTPAAPYHRPQFGRSRLPAHWIIRQRRSVIWSTVSIVRAFDRMKTGPERVEFSISPTHTQTLVDLLDEMRRALADFAELAEAGAGSDRKMWSRQMARTLVQIERVSRMVSLDEGADGQGDPGGLAAGPLLQMLAAYLNENSRGLLLGDLVPEDIDKLRTVLTQVVLRLGFELAGKQLPADLRQAATSMMRQAESPASLEEPLAGLVLDRVERAPPAAGEGQAGKIVRLVTSWAPRGIEMFQAFIKQWDRMESIELEFRQLGDQPIIAVAISVLPGKEVRIGDVIVGQPAVVFRGTSRIVVIPETRVLDETVVIFQPTETGAAELRFEGLIYGLVRLLAVPLADGALREVRVFKRSAKQGYQVLNVQLLTEALGGKGDPRRLMVFQDVRKKRLVRRAFSLESIEEQKVQAFSYLTPKRHYAYRRIKQSDAAGVAPPAGVATRR